MPQANDAELTELYTSAPGLDVEDSEPNTGAPGGNPTANFQLHLEAVAGNVIGNGGGNYRLEITCIDETLAAPNPSMSPGVLNQQFLNTDGWQAGGPAGTSSRSRSSTSTSTTTPAATCCATSPPW